MVELRIWSGDFWRGWFLQRMPIKFQLIYHSWILLNKYSILRLSWRHECWNKRLSRIFWATNILRRSMLFWSFSINTSYSTSSDHSSRCWLQWWKFWQFKLNSARKMLKVLLKDDLQWWVYRIIFQIVQERHSNELGNRWFFNIESWM